MSKFWLALGGVVAATIVDLIYMIWTREGKATALTTAGWHSSSLGKGNVKYDVINKFKNYKGKY